MRKFYLSVLILAGLVLVGCGSTNEPAPNSPNEALQQYFAASQRQDIAKMKSLLSKDSLAFIEKNGQAQNLSVDDILRKESSVKIQNAPVTRNAQIEGDTATLEIKNETTGEFDMKMPFVREDGAWKLARDKYIAEVLKKANEAREKMISEMANAARSNSNTSKK